jgi:hypothetical protein
MSSDDLVTYLPDRSPFLYLFDLPRQIAENQNQSQANQRMEIRSPLHTANRLSPSGYHSYPPLFIRRLSSAASRALSSVKNRSLTLSV